MWILLLKEWMLLLRNRRTLGMANSSETLPWKLLISSPKNSVNTAKKRKKMNRNSTIMEKKLMFKKEKTPKMICWKYYKLNNSMRTISPTRYTPWVMMIRRMRTFNRLDSSRNPSSHIQWIPSLSEKLRCMKLHLQFMHQGLFRLIPTIIKRLWPVHSHRTKTPTVRQWTFALKTTSFCKTHHNPTASHLTRSTRKYLTWQISPKPCYTNWTNRATRTNR